MKLFDRIWTKEGVDVDSHGNSLSEIGFDVSSVIVVITWLQRIK